MEGCDHGIKKEGNCDTAQNPTTSSRAAASSAPPSPRPIFRPRLLVPVHATAHAQPPPSSSLTALEADQGDARDQLGLLRGICSSRCSPSPHCAQPHLVALPTLAPRVAGSGGRRGEVVEGGSRTPRIGGACGSPSPLDGGRSALPHPDGLVCVGVGDGQPPSRLWRRGGGGFPRDGYGSRRWRCRAWTWTSYSSTLALEVVGRGMEMDLVVSHRCVSSSL